MNPITNPWQQAIDDELISAHLGIARNEVTREEAKAQLNKLIAWHIDVANYFESQAQQSQWISVEERLPEEGAVVDVNIKSKSNSDFRKRKTSVLFSCGSFQLDYTFDSEYVSHWMPIPPAPEGGDK